MARSEAVRTARVVARLYSRVISAEVLATTPPGATRSPRAFMRKRPRVPTAIWSPCCASTASMSISAPRIVTTFIRLPSATLCGYLGA